MSCRCARHSPNGGRVYERLGVNFIPILVQRYNRARILRAFNLDAATVLDARYWVRALGLDGTPRDVS